MTRTSRFYEEFTVGQFYTTTSRLITLEDHMAFCKLVRYEVPLFLQPEVGQKAGFGGVICPSHLIMSFSTAMTGMLFSESILGLVSLDKARFLAPVRPGDTIRTEVEVLAKKPTSNPAKGLVTFRDHVFNQRDELVFQNDKTALIKCAGPQATEGSSNA